MIITLHSEEPNLLFPISDNAVGDVLHPLWDSITKILIDRDSEISQVIRRNWKPFFPVRVEPSWKKRLERVDLLIVIYFHEIPPLPLEKEIPILYYPWKPETFLRGHLDEDLAPF